MMHCTCSPCFGWLGSCLFAKCWAGSLRRWIGSGCMGPANCWMLLAYMSTGSTMLHCTCSPCLGWVGSCLFAKCWTGSLIRWIGSGWVQHPCPPLREPERDGAGRGRPGAEQHRDGYLPIADDVRRSNRGPFILASDVTRVLGARGRRWNTPLDFFWKGRRGGSTGLESKMLCCER